ncbi:pyridoxal-phosphate dependent enzyme [Amycolatopsis magusensis]|uniref:pyridoxal-phosphate dependent enzyme n=1 Tax=Amycolatopsis magusensis TaxID=882444 RepID=UPI003C2D54D0
MVTIEDVEAAAARLAGQANRTPVLTSRTLDARTGAEVFLKAENFQRVGAFKFRGAYNAIAQLSGDRLAAGVCTHSSGNHAQAVALAARLLGTKATILMPADAPESKVDAVLGYGAEVRRFDRYTEDRFALCEKLAADNGYALIPPFDHPHVIAGQGTATLEFLAECPDLDALITPMGGGGLMAGAATVASARRPGLELIGVEPEAGDDQKQSLEAGKLISVPVPKTVADGLALPSPGVLNFEINRKHVRRIVTVTDEQILDAMRFLFERTKIVVEPSGAAAVAALLAEQVRLPGKRVGVLLSGGNVAADRFAALLRS